MLSEFETKIRAVLSTTANMGLAQAGPDNVTSAFQKGGEGVRGWTYSS